MSVNIKELLNICDNIKKRNYKCYCGEPINKSYVAKFIKISGKIRCVNCKKHISIKCAKCLVKNACNKSHFFCDYCQVCRVCNKCEICNGELKLMNNITCDALICNDCLLQWFTK